MKNTTIFLIILGILLTIILTLYFYKNQQHDNNEMFEDGDIKKILKSLKINLEQAKKIFKPATPDIPKYEYIKKDTSTTILQNGKEILIPPLIADYFQDPRKILKNPFKTTMLVEKNDKKEDFRIINIGETLTNYRLNLPRGGYPLNTTFGFDTVIDDVEYDQDINNTGSLAENIRGFSLVYGDNNVLSVYTANRNRILKYNTLSSINPINSTLFNQPGFIKSKPSNCSTNSKWGYGQVSYLKKLGISTIDGVLCPIICSNGSRIELININSMRQILGTINMSEDIRWLAYDSISGYVAVPSTYDVSSIKIYDFNYQPNRFDKRLILTSDLLDNNGNSFTVTKVTAGCFDKDGVLYLLSNDENRNKTGIYIFDSTDSMRTFKLRTRLNQNITDYASGSDKKYVGLGVDLQRNIYCLVKNEDVGDDNISLFKLTPNFILPQNFNWADSTSVMANRGINYQISPVLMQNTCGSCWAFASASTLADRIAIVKNQQVAEALSATRILSCDKSLGHCNGAFIENVQELLEEKGTVLNSCWDYNWCSTDPQCSSGGAGSEFSSEEDVSTETIDSLIPSCLTYQNKCVSCDNSTGRKRCTILPGYPSTYRIIKDSFRGFDNKDDMKVDIFNNGPIIGVFRVKKDFYNGAGIDPRNVTNGIYCHMNNYNVYGVTDYNTEIGGHAVEIVGWGREPVSRSALGLAPARISTIYIDYWIIKNSWGTTWGNSGYAKFAMSNPIIGLNTNIGFDSTVPVNILGLQFGRYGSLRFLADPRSPYPPDMCEYRCPNILLERRCPGQREFSETLELCYHD